MDLGVAGRVEGPYGGFRVVGPEGREVAASRDEGSKKKRHPGAKGRAGPLTEATTALACSPAWAVIGQSLYRKGAASRG